MSSAVIEPNQSVSASLPAVPGPLRRLYLFFWSPGELFSTLRESPNVVVPLLIVCVLSVALSLAMSPLVIKVAAHSLPEGLPAAQVESFHHQIELGQRISVLLLPVILLIKTLFAALVLTMLAIVIAGDGSFKKTFSVLSYTSIIMVLEGGCALLVLYLRGTDQIAKPADLQVQLGLDLFINTQNAALNAALNAVNLFEIWYVSLLVIAVGCLFKCSKKRAATIAITYWTMTVAVQVAIAILGNAAGTGAR
jgi:hypothetical protein